MSDASGKKSTVVRDLVLAGVCFAVAGGLWMLLRSGGTGEVDTAQMDRLIQERHEAMAAAHAGAGADEVGVQAGAEGGGVPFALWCRQWGESPVEDAERFEAINGKDVQVTFFSSTPIEDIEGISNQVEGVAWVWWESAEDGREVIQMEGGWRLPVVSMRTGIANRDEHLREADWLDAARWPHVVFEMQGFEDVAELEGSAASQGRTFEGTLVGTMRIKGERRAVRIAGARVSVREESEATRAAVGRAGRVVAVRAGFEVRLADYGIEHYVISERNKVAEVIELDVMLVMGRVGEEGGRGVAGVEAE